MVSPFHQKDIGAFKHVVSVKSFVQKNQQHVTLNTENKKLRVLVNNILAELSKLLCYYILICVLRLMRRELRQKLLS